MSVSGIETISTGFEKRFTTAVRQCVKPFLFLRPNCSCQQQRRTCHLPIIAAILSTNLCAAVIVGTLVARPDA